MLIVNMCMEGVLRMNENLIALHELSLGDTGTVKKLTSQGIVRRRMLDLGIIPNTSIKLLRKSPAGDPIAYKIRETVIALRKDESSSILVDPFEKEIL